MVKTFCKNCLERISGTVCSACGYDNEAGEVKTGYLPPGTILAEKYMIGRLLGHGGFGATYLGFDMTLEEKVAIKEYLPKGMASRNTDRITVISYDGEKETYDYGLKQFVREANTLARFNILPSVTSIYDTIEANGTAYIVMEFVEGHTLDEILKQRSAPMSVDETLSIITPILETLSKVHRAGIIHRDIAPDNILVMDNGKVKLLDFGAARYALGEKSQSLSVIVKHGFAPPEQYTTHGKQGPWTDIYAICATMYVMLTKNPLPSATDIMLGQAFETIPSINHHVPAALDWIIKKGLETDYTKRWQTVQELQRQFAGISGSNAAGSDPVYDGTAGGRAFDRSVAANQGTVPRGRIDQNAFRPDKKKNKVIPWLIGGAVVIAAIIAVIIAVQPKAPMGAISEGNDEPSPSKVVSAETDAQETQTETDIPSETQASESALPTEKADPQVIVFSDDNFEKAVREALGKPEGEIYSTEVESIGTLDLSDKAIEDISGIEYFNSLTELKLGGNDISDINALSGLIQLTSLEIYENRIENISPLAALNNLTFLYISDNQINNIDALSNLTQLSSLLLSGNPLEDIDALANLTKLTLLHISRTGITDISALAKLTRLTVLYIRSNQLENIDVLSRLKNLEVLQLEKNRISDITPLSGLRNLTELHLNDNEIKDIGPLANLIRLSKLYLLGNPIRDYSPVEQLDIADKDF